MMIVKDAVVVCHNVPFDLGFLSSELERINKSLPTTLVLDTLEVARQHFDFDFTACNPLRMILILKFLVRIVPWTMP